MPTTEFSCTQCGACCRAPGYVYLTGEDLAELARALNLTEEAIVEQFAELGPNRAQLVLRPCEERGCVFLSDGRCEVYSMRPRQCRDYPERWGGDSPCPGLTSAPY